MIFAFFNQIIKKKQNTLSQRAYLNYYKNVFSFFFNTYKNEWKEHKF